MPSVISVKDLRQLVDDLENAPESTFVFLIFKRGQRLPNLGGYSLDFERRRRKLGEKAEPPSWLGMEPPS